MNYYKARLNQPIQTLLKVQPLLTEGPKLTTEIEKISIDYFTVQTKIVKVNIYFECSKHVKINGRSI